MFKRIFATAALLLAAACASNETQVKEAIRKDPKIVFDVIEENPEQFMEVVNRAAQLAQKKQYEKQISEMNGQQEKDLKEPKQPVLVKERRLAGNDDGKIIIVEYGDFQCPYCKMGYDSMRQFKEKHKDQIQFYFKNVPLDFHKMAMPSAIYFEAIKLQDISKARKFYDLLFQNQNDLSEDYLKKAARQIGVNMKRLETDLKSDVVKANISEDMNEFQKFGFNGTPTVIINGVALSGAQKLEELERVAALTAR